ncbi:44629_t:CDS:2 [Gigaspora margarita]|uniref:44629_t:CDS:1 n=1 Tax=Gigaspora margarita TaxID=4874 RepID=A0ABN7VBS4_GIGMA|nr:44629_t:CDS:2 [Gigaspora margarita]
MIYLHASNDQELLQLLAKHAQNPDYGFVLNLFQQYRDKHLGEQYSITIFQHLKHEVDNYNNSGQGHAILQEYNSQLSNEFILYIVTNLMSHVHEKIRQLGELCYVDALVSFEPLNTSITLFYTSCIVGALPLGLIITSNKLEITLEKGFTLLKEPLPQHAFFNCGSNTGPMIFFTNDSRAKQNVLRKC